MLLGQAGDQVVAARRAGRRVRSSRMRSYSGSSSSRMSCSSTGVPRSSAKRTRDGALDELAVGADPADPQPAPDGLADRADGDGAADRRERRAGSLAVEAELAHRLVDDERRALPRGEVDGALAQPRRHRAAGGVVVVGHEVAERRARALERLLEGELVPALVGGHRHRHEPGAARAQRLEGVRIARRLDERTVAARQQGAGQQADRVLGADRDHDLVGVGRQSARRVAVGERLPQHAQARAGRIRIRRGRTGAARRRARWRRRPPAPRAGSPC